MNNEIKKYIDKTIEGFQKYKGKACVYCKYDFIIDNIINIVILKFVNKRNNAIVKIIVDNDITRRRLAAFLKLNNMYINNIKIHTIKFINENDIDYNENLIITVGLETYAEQVYSFTKLSKFILNIFYASNINVDTFIIHNIAPTILLGDISNKIIYALVYSPVEEHRIYVPLADKDRQLYDDYTKYINNCISIFGSLDVIEKCRVGDNENNISAVSMRTSVAESNGWREDLDTTIPYLKEIDDIFNPNVLEEKAFNFYNVTRERRNLVENYKAKLDIILNICKEHKDDKILIVSKHGSFANDIIKYLKEHDVDCLGYHNELSPVPAYDGNGIPILIKSGAKKGQQKIISHQAQSSANERLFIEGYTNVLSIKQSSNTKLGITCNLVILTSPLLGDIADIKRRFCNVRFTYNPTIIYKVYCKSTIEQDKLDIGITNHITNVINENENNISFDENTGDIVL